MTENKTNQVITENNKNCNCDHNKINYIKILKIFLFVLLLIIITQYVFIFFNAYIVGQFWKEKPDWPFSTSHTSSNESIEIK